MMKNTHSKPKTAIICDWLTEIGGAEKVLEQVSRMFPEAPIFTSQYRERSAPKYFAKKDIRTGWLNIFPRSLRKFISPLRYIYFNHLNLREFDLIISINNAEAKNISRKNLKPGATHISYLQGPPTQYYWGLYDRYIENPGFGKLNFIARFGLKLLVKPLRKIDLSASKKPHFLVANSHYVAREIKKYYGRESEVLWPNVDVKSVQEFAKKVDKKTAKEIRENLFHGEEFFMIAGRQVNWKRMDVAINFAKETGKNLLVIGDGAEHENLLSLAEKFENIKFLPRYNGAADLAKYLIATKAFLFTSLEPFGITPVEALAAGTPVIAFNEGGSRDFVNEKNGEFFAKQTPKSLANAVEKFEKKKFQEKDISKSTEEFSSANFAKNLEKIINEKV